MEVEHSSVDVIDPEDTGADAQPEIESDSAADAFKDSPVESDPPFSGDTFVDAPADQDPAF